VREAERKQRSREFGIKLAKALGQRANEARRDHDLDVGYVMLGAAEYLRKAADSRTNAPIDDANVAPDDRVN